MLVCFETIYGMHNSEYEQFMMYSGLGFGVESNNSKKYNILLMI